MFMSAARLAILAAALSFGAAGIALAATGLGLPFIVGAVLAAAAAGLVMYAAARTAAPPDRSMEAGLQARLDEYRAAFATLRHDIRGALSPALMMSDRLLGHADPAVQRSGQAVVRSVERATGILASNRQLMAEPEPDARLPAPPPR